MLRNVPECSMFLVLSTARSHGYLFCVLRGKERLLACPVSYSSSSCHATRFSQFSLGSFSSQTQFSKSVGEDC